MGRAVRIACYQSLGVSPVILRNSEGRIIVSSDPADLLRFLFTSSSATLRCFWRLDSGIAPIIRTLPIEVCESLSSTHKASYAGYSLFYIPFRIFSITNSNITARFYSLYQYWSDDDSEPSTIEETQQLADSLLDTLAQLGIPGPTTLASPVACFLASDRGKAALDLIPKDCDTPPACLEAQEYAMRADHRLWISAYQIGHFDSAEGNECFDYDLSGAFPGIAAQLLDLRDMYYRKSTALDETAYYGFVKGKLRIYPESRWSFCHPLMIRVGTMLANPVGNYPEDYYTLNEIRYVHRYGLGEFKLKDGWFLKPIGGVRPRQPFKDTMDDLYSQRSRSSLASSVGKYMANGLIGKLREKRRTEDGGEVYGDLHNPIYHALITSETRLRVFDFLVQHDVQPTELVHIGVDGCKLTRHIFLPASGRGLGTWKCLGAKPTIVLSPGKVYVGNKHPGSLYYQDVVDMIQDHPSRNHYEKVVEHRTTLAQAVSAGDLSSVGELRDVPTSIDFNTLQLDVDRVFGKLPKTGAALLDRTYQAEPIEL